MAWRRTDRPLLSGHMARGSRGIDGHPSDMDGLDSGSSRRILLAIDQTSASREASSEAIKRAKEDGSELIVMSVVEPRNLHLPGGRPRRVDQERERLTAGAQSIVQRARAVGVRSTFLIWEGEPADAILEAATSEGATIIILGSRPRTNLRRFILGSVSSEVARRAPCDVVVVPG